MSAQDAAGRRTDIRDALHGKHDQVFTLVSPTGDIVPGAFDGVYFHDTPMSTASNCASAGRASRLSWPRSV